MNKYKKYDIASKIEIVEEYLELNKNGKQVSLRDFASRKDISKTTLYDWITTYKKNGLSNDESTNEVVNMNTDKPRFIEISKDTIVNAESIVDNRNTIKLCYKDVTLEFGSDNLMTVMDLIRRW